MAAIHALAAAALIIVSISVMASAKSTGEAVDCTTVVLSMADCLSYVSNGSKVETPEGNCCSGLKSVLKTNPDCLCQAFKSSAQFGVVLNVSKALSLPQACHVHASSVDNCGLSLSPASAPVVGAPAGTPSLSIANAPAIDIVGNDVAPGIAPSKTSSSVVISTSIQLIVMGIAATFFFSS